MATPETLGRLKDIWESCKAQDDQKAALIEVMRSVFPSRLE